MGAGATLQVTGVIQQAKYAAPTTNSARLSAGGGTLELQNTADLSGGYVTTGAGGLVHVTGSAVIDGGLTDAAIAVDAGASLALGQEANRGTVTNAGTVYLDDAIDNAGGVIQSLAASTLILSTGVTVQGGTLAGARGATPAVMTAIGKATLDGSASTLTNTGSLHATMQPGVTDRTQTLTLTGTINQYTAAQSGELVADNADIILSHAVLQNGTLRTVGTGQFVVSADLVLDGTTHGLTLPGAVSISRSTLLTLRGDIVNTGSITVHGDSGYATTYLKVTGTASLTGGGVLRLTDDYTTGGNTAVVTGTSSSDLLDNVDNLIVGFGSLGSGGLGLRNEAAGTIDAETGTLTLAPGAGGLANTGLLEATKGGTLNLEANIANAGGRILAADGSTVRLGADGIRTTIAGGRIEAAGSGAVTVDQTDATLDGTGQAVTIAESLVLYRGRTLTLQGALTNDGLLTINGTSGYARAVLLASGTASLSGGGTVHLFDDYTPGGNSAAIAGSSTADTLDNVDNTIYGAGEIGLGTLTLSNEAAATIDAAGATLYVKTGTAAVSNAGLMEATASGTLDLASAVANTGHLLAAATGQIALHAVVSGPGSVTVATGGKLLLSGGTLQGSGTLTAATGSQIEVTGTGTIDGRSQTVSLSGTTTIDHATTLTILGPIGNAGAIAINGTSGYPRAVLLASGTASLSGGGTVHLFDDYTPGGDSAAIAGSSTADTLDNVDNTIYGAGEIGLGTLTLSNDAAATIDATVATLFVNTGASAITNAGLMEATSAGTLDVASAIVNTGRMLAAEPHRSPCERR